jgi:hypothetical protein
VILCFSFFWIFNVPAVPVMQSLWMSDIWAARDEKTCLPQSSSQWCILSMNIKVQIIPVCTKILKSITMRCNNSPRVLKEIIRNSHMSSNCAAPPCNVVINILCVYIHYLRTQILHSLCVNLCYLLGNK